MRRSKWVLHFEDDNEEECFIRIKIFVGNVFAGSIWGDYSTGMWKVNLFIDWNTLHTTDYFDRKEYKTLQGAKRVAIQWIKRNWKVNLEGEKK